MLTTNQTRAIEWIDAQLLKPNDRFILKQGIHINDLHSCLKTQKERIIFGIDPLFDQIHRSILSRSRTGISLYFHLSQLFTIITSGSADSGVYERGIFRDFRR